MHKLSIQLQPSKQLAILLSLAHCTAAGAFWPLALPMIVKMVIIFLLAGSLYYYLRRYAWLISAQSIVALHLTERNQCEVKTNTGSTIDTVIDASTFVAPYMTVLCLKEDRIHRYRTVVILPDGIDAYSFRQLRIWLKWRWRADSASKREQH